MFTEEELNKKNLKEVQEIAKNYGISENRFMELNTKASLIIELKKMGYFNHETNKKNNYQSNHSKKTSPQKDNSEYKVKTILTEEKIDKTFFGHLYDYLNKNQKIIQAKPSSFKLTNTLELYEDFEINSKDKIEAKTPYDCCPYVIALNNKEEFSGVLKLLQVNHRHYYFLADKGDIVFKNFKNSGIAKLLFFNITEINLFKSRDLNNISKELTAELVKIDGKIIDAKEPDDDQRLCIDFGTSNTTVGTYKKDKTGYSIEIVDFLIKKENSFSKLLPTVVYVKDCSNEKDIKYLFGHDAKEREKELNYSLKATIYYEIKRWINDYDRIEEIRDEFDNTLRIKRIDIIKAYLQFVIDTAEHHFKTKYKLLHFSTPVKMKEKYIEMFSKVFPEHNISQGKNCIDEGFSIIYHRISEQIKENWDKNEKPFLDDSKIMIVDSGGGTTDLASCSFNFEYKDNGAHLKIESQFEDGNSNFGGNNLTYRIMQFIKIKLAAFYFNDIESNAVINCEISKLLKPENDVKTLIDSFYSSNHSNMNTKHENIYDIFETEYNKAEDYIPTKFNNNLKYRDSDNVNKIKTNFYLLWNIAETVKKEFFKRNDFMMINFLEDDIEKGIIKLPQFNKLNISIAKNNDLEEVHNLPSLNLSIKEIKSLIYGDIYNLLCGLFANKTDEELLAFDRYIFSGQTCKIDLFEDLFREFVPGRRLRDKMSTNTNYDDSTRFKLLCIEGSILFNKDKETGLIVPEITNKNASLQFKIESTRGNKVILSNEHCEIEVFALTAHYKMDFNVYRKDIKIRDDSYKFNIEQHGEKKELNNFPFSDDIKEKLNNVEGDKRIIVAQSTEDNFGFNLYEIKKEKNQFFLINRKYYNFEQDLSDLSFFNGEK
ncbi:MAG: hypothetical protein WC963_05395 [Bacilli bacterium]